MNRANPKVDGFLRHSKRWQKELQKLRSIILDSELTEEVKWRVPCYTLKGKNVLLINGFKEFCALSFVKGTLLKDVEKILARIGENTQAGRWIKFTSMQEIDQMEPTLKKYIQEAIAVEKSGMKVELKKTTDFKVPEEFKKRLSRNRALKTAFEALTPGRQRGYLLHFSAPKQSKMRDARIEKNMQRILDKKGLND